MSITGYSVGDAVKIIGGPRVGDHGVIIGPSSSAEYPMSVELPVPTLATGAMVMNYHFRELSVPGTGGGE